MNEIITWVWAIIIAVSICSIVLAPLFGLCYTFMKVKMAELKDKVGH